MILDLRLTLIFHFVNLYHFVDLLDGQCKSTIACMSRGIMLKNHVIETITSSRSAIHCYNLCFLRDSCQSINYNKISHICELNDETVTSFPKDSTASSGYSYYSTDICKQGPRPCKDSERCVDRCDAIGCSSRGPVCQQLGSDQAKDVLCYMKEEITYGSNMNKTCTLGKTHLNDGENLWLTRKDSYFCTIANGKSCPSLEGGSGSANDVGDNDVTTCVAPVTNSSKTSFTLGLKDEIKVASVGIYRPPGSLHQYYMVYAYDVSNNFQLCRKWRGSQAGGTWLYVDCQAPVLTKYMSVQFYVNQTQIYNSVCEISLYA